MDIVILIMLWELSLVAAFLLGKNHKGKARKVSATEDTVNDENNKSLARIQKEYENFMTYDGTPQNAINDFD